MRSAVRVGIAQRAATRTRPATRTEEADLVTVTADDHLTAASRLFGGMEHVQVVVGTARQLRIVA